MGANCSPCFGTRTRAFLAAILQLILGLALMSLHILSELKIIKDSQVYGPYFIAVTTSKAPQQNYDIYHITSAILAFLMVIFTIIFFLGLFKNRADYICAWIAINWLLVFCYALVLLHSLNLWILGFIIENILILSVTINFICCVCPLYEDMKSCKQMD